MSYSSFRINSGYIGQRMSVRAMEAHESGKLPLSKLPLWAKALVKSDQVQASEWHHTGKFFTKTDFFSPQDFFPLLTECQVEGYNLESIESFDEVPKAIIKIFRQLAKDIEAKNEAERAFKKDLIEAAKEGLRAFNKGFPTFDRVRNTPEYGYIITSEMHGKNGWFEANPRYNTDTYYSGIDYMTADNYTTAAKLRNRIDFLENYQTAQLVKLGIITDALTDAELNNISKEVGPIIDFLQVLQELPKIGEEFKPSYLWDYEAFLTSKEKNQRQNQHEVISMNLGNLSSRERYLDHCEVDQKYDFLMQERAQKDYERFLLSPEVETQREAFEKKCTERDIIIQHLAELVKGTRP